MKQRLPMNEERLRACVQQNCELVVLASVTSTNDEVAKRLRTRAVPPTDSPLVVVSTAQTAGRGRLGRTWVSPQGGVYISVGLPLPASSAEESPVGALSPLTALAVRSALEGFSDDKLLIKWPNDIHSSSGKLGGILVEVKGPWAVVGVGINVNRPAEGAFEGAGYLDDGAAGPLSLEEVTAAAITSIIACYKIWQSEDYSFAPFQAAYSENMALLGEWVFVRDAMGREVAQGIVEGIDNHGRLLLAHSEGISAVFAGEITLRSQ